MRLIFLAGWIGCCAAGGCRGADKDLDPTGGKAMTISVTSTAFEAGKPIPKKYTGEGEDLSPPLAWSNVPPGTKELALICDDPDAPGGTWVHWLLYKLPAGVASLPEGLPREKILKTPAGAVQGINSWSADNLGYRGPKPPPGRTSLPLQDLCARQAAIRAAGHGQEDAPGRGAGPRAGPRGTGGNVSAVTGRIPSSKSQISNKFQIRMTKCSKRFWSFEFHPFGFVWDLRFEILDLGFGI